MPIVVLKVRNGDDVPIEMPAPGHGRSCFLIGLHKAGSTLMNNVMKPLSEAAGSAYFSLPNLLHKIGLPFNTIEAGIGDIFHSEGYTYGGFRGIDANVVLPAFASGRTILLVRDPRDIVTSLYFSEAFSHRAPGAVVGDDMVRSFAANREAALAEPIDTYALRRGAGVLRSYENTLSKLDGIANKVYRYEDVIFRKVEWIKDVLSHLELEVNPQRVINIVGRHDITPDAEDVTKHIRRVTPGDHKDKLRSETIERLNAMFAPVLRRFDYA